MENIVCCTSENEVIRKKGARVHNLFFFFLMTPLCLETTYFAALDVTKHDKLICVIALVLKPPTESCGPETVSKILLTLNLLTI